MYGRLRYRVWDMSGQTSMAVRDLVRRVHDMVVAPDDHCHLLRCFLDLRRRQGQTLALILEMAPTGMILSVVVAGLSTTILAAVYGHS